MSFKRLFDEIMEAATFAEADHPDARAIASRIFPGERGSGTASRILAVAGADGFSPAMVERSLALAARLGCGLVAMTAGGEHPARRRPRRRELTGPAFGDQAADRGIPFSYVAWPGDPAQGVAEATRRLRRIAFLFVEAELAPRLAGARLGIPWFRLEE